LGARQASIGWLHIFVSDLHILAKDLQIICEGYFYMRSSYFWHELAPIPDLFLQDSIHPIFIPEI